MEVLSPEVLDADVEDARTIGGKGGRLPRKRCGGDGAGFELTIGAAADPAAKPLGW